MSRSNYMADYRRLDNNPVEAGNNRFEFTVNHVEAEDTYFQCGVNRFQNGIDYS